MKIEDVIKSNSELAIEKKTLLNVMYSQNIISEKFNEVLKPFELSAEQFNVLRILRGQNKKALNMCDIQERMIAKTSNTTRLVDKLLLKGYVTRDICPDNRRKMEIGITQRGLDILEKLDPLVINHEKHFSKNLNKSELITLNKLLEKFRTL
jgi:DNA-binding MarR family transcriptional regulator